MYKEELLEQLLINSGYRKKFRADTKRIYDICSKSPKALLFLVSGEPLDFERMKYISVDGITAVFLTIAKYNYITAMEEETYPIIELFKKQEKDRR